LTANAINGDRELCLTAGMDDYLTKPFTRCQLCSVLRTLLAPSGFVEEPEQDNSPSPETPPVASENAVFDDNVLNALRQLQRAGRPDIVQRTLDLYLENAPRLLRELQDGAANGDVATLGRASHMLKSNSANVGALKLASRCNELETLARAGSVARAAELVAGVGAEFEAVKAALNAHLAKVA
jgi:two-component system sensor histidine kinase/response regulator